MPTFLNKVFVGRQDGGVEIWNLSTGKLIYTIQPLEDGSGAVTALEAAPPLSLLAIAYANGTLVIHNVHTDEVVVQLRQTAPQKVPITSISFRTDGLGAGKDGQEDGVMATASIESGDVTLWDLNDGGRITGVLRGAHEMAGSRRATGINRVEFLSGQPVLMSSGLDNALRSWILDETPFSPIPRPLHSRHGHSAVITKLMFLPANSDGSEASGKWLLSASKDRSLWGFSLRKDGQSTELSQGHIRRKANKLGLTTAMGGGTTVSEDLKAPEISCIASSLNRDGGMGATGGGQVWANMKLNKAEESNATGWESVVTAHSRDKFARTWFWGKKKAGRWAFESGDATEVKSVAVTACGTFALVGSSGGSLDMFNLQSGIHRQRFPPRLSPAEVKRLQSLGTDEALRSGRIAHGKSVSGIVVDPLNKTVISCSLDGTLKFWDFLTGKLQHEIEVAPSTAATGLRYDPVSDLVALSCDDAAIRLFDTETKRLVRELWGCAGQIYDYCFSPDGRWIVASSTNSGIQVWDLPTGHLVNAFRTHRACTSLAFSTTGEFLATAHADEIGIRIWNNRSLFVHVPTTNIEEGDVVETDSTDHDGIPTIDAAFDDEAHEELDSGVHSTMEQLSHNILTLSLVPKSRWQTLIHLDMIKQRNKPIEPPKTPAKAPFFLSSSLTQDGQHEGFGSKETPRVPAEASRVQKTRHSVQESTFTALLRAASKEAGSNSFTDYLQSLPPAAIDLEIRSLQASELRPFVTALTKRLLQRRDYELVNAWMAVFLRVQSETVIRDTAALAALRDWRHEQEREGKRLAKLVGYCSGILGFLRSSRA